MTGRQRLIATINHEESDRVPISPRIDAWMTAEYGNSELKTLLEKLPDLDPMYILYNTQPNYMETYPDIYELPDVKVEQKKYRKHEFIIVERTFFTPAGKLSDRTKIPPSGREYGVFPNPIKTEYLIKEAYDLEALQYILPEINTNYDILNQYEHLIGDRGVIMVCIRSALDHNAGFARDMQNLMMDYFDDRIFFDKLINIFHQRSIAQTKAALEGGAKFIFGSWYFNSLSSGWSPAIFEQAFVPQITEHVELTHNYDAYYDYYDDGKLNNSMEKIAATGVDVLETCTPPPVGDFDLLSAKEKIGNQTTIKGYIDLVYVIKLGTPELIDKTIRETMAIAKPGGGFIIGSSDSFREGTSKENIDSYFNACKKYGVYK